MFLFDMHTHCFPDALAERALAKLGEIAKSPYYGTGTYADLVEKETAAGCTGFMILHIATKPSQMQAVNQFAASCQKGNVYCFGSVFPTAENAVEELHRISALGLKGVKFHPDYQNFFVDDPAVFPVYAAAEQLQLPVVFHAGRDPYSPDVVHCTPEMLATVAKAFPKLNILAAHMGGMEMAEQVDRFLLGQPNVYLDTAFATRSLTPEQCCRQIRRHGVERVFFATDFPWSTVEQELSFLRRAGLTAAELDLILHRNAERFFHISLSE